MTRAPIIHNRNKNAVFDIICTSAIIFIAVIIPLNGYRAWPCQFKSIHNWSWSGGGGGGDISITIEIWTNSHFLVLNTLNTYLRWPLQLQSLYGCHLIAKTMHWSVTHRNSLPTHLTFFIPFLFFFPLEKNAGLIKALAVFFILLFKRFNSKRWKNENSIHCRIFTMFLSKNFIMSPYFGGFHYIFVCPLKSVHFRWLSGILFRYFGTEKIFALSFFLLFYLMCDPCWLDSVFIIMSCTRQTQQYLVCLPCW